MKKADVSKTGSVDAVYSGIKKILEEARSTAYRAVNFAMVQAYWNIGRVIVEEKNRREKQRQTMDKLSFRNLLKGLRKNTGKDLHKLIYGICVNFL